MRVAIAPDSLKGSLSADSAARAIAEGWRRVRPGDELVLMPQADGGEGTLDAIEACVEGARRHAVFPVDGPDGRPTRGEWLVLPDGTAVVELAQMCGLPLMTEPDPLGASTGGLGQTIAAALKAGATSLVIALGGLPRLMAARARCGRWVCDCTMPGARHSGAVEGRSPTSAGSTVLVSLRLPRVVSSCLLT
jgi:glycerate kinase